MKWLAAIIASIAIVVSRDVRADEARHVVRVIVAGDESQSTALETSLREMLVRLHLTLESRRAERVDLDDASALGVPSPDALATAWIDLTSPSHATVVLVDGAGHVVEKRVVPSEGSPAIAVEGVAQIIYTSAEDIVIRTTQSSPPPPSLSPPPPPSLSPSPSASLPPPPHPTPWALMSSAFIAGSTLGDGAPIIATGALGVDLINQHLRTHPSIRVWAMTDVPFSISSPLVSLDAATLGLRAAPTLRVVGSSSFSLEVGADFGMDVWWITPHGTGLPSDLVRSQSTNISPMAGALASLRLAVGPSVDFVVTLGCDFDLLPRRYIVAEGPNADVVFQPWPVRPSLSIGFDVLTLGRRWR